MQTVILCGGKGSRMGATSGNIPKPLITIGDRPVLWHLMKYFSHFGFSDFILCLGYKGGMIREYFESSKEKWNIEFADTGLESTKSERLAKIKRLIEGDFFVSYGDDLTDASLHDIVSFHKKHRPVVTLTAVRLQSPYGILKTSNEKITGFAEKPLLNEWINGGYMAAGMELFGYLKLGELEEKVFPALAKEGKICAYKHSGSWKSMNTMKDNAELNELWSQGRAFWKVW